MRLIDADALVKDLELLAKFQPEYKQSTILGVCETIKATKTVDAVPVRHGRWIPNGDDDMDAGMWHCSECGHEIYSDLSLMEELQEQGYALYCEHCGLKMDLEE